MTSGGVSTALCGSVDSKFCSRARASGGLGLVCPFCEPGRRSGAVPDGHFMTTVASGKVGPPE